MFLSNNMKSSEKNKFKKPNILRKKPKAAMTPYTSSDSAMVSLVKPSSASGLRPESELRDQNTIKFINKCEYKPIVISSTIQLSTNCLKANISDALTSQNLIGATIDDGANNNAYANLFDNALEIKENNLESNVAMFEEAPELFVCTPDTLFPVESIQMPVGQPIITTTEFAPIMFKCDIDSCKKEFPSKQKLKKHKARHNKNPCKIVKQQFSCPAKKAGLEETDPCDQVFMQKEELVNHLKTEHTLDEALHCCGQCGRRFFRVMGLRAHRAACGGRRRRAALACPFEGCGRVFQQPCRLREHARAHTGDRPYPCLHPNCGWSFRSASKLIRHTRAHSGERRHACAACGQLFTRREHLREHAARHARSAPSRQRRAESNEQFKDAPDLPSNAATDDSAATADSVTVQEPAWTPHDAFVDDASDSLAAEESSGSPPCPTTTSSEDDAEWRAARTHCTWPLAPSPSHSLSACPSPSSSPSSPSTSEAPPSHHEEPFQRGESPCAEYFIKVELSEEPAGAGGAGGVGGVGGAGGAGGALRSDLFLHAPRGEDSGSNEVRPRGTDFDSCAEGGGGGNGAGEDAEGAGGSIDADLGLLEHPTMDLMQEELMYSDAVDASPFHVLLLGDL